MSTQGYFLELLISGRLKPFLDTLEINDYSLVKFVDTSYFESLPTIFSFFSIDEVYAKLTLEFYPIFVNKELSTYFSEDLFVLLILEDLKFVSGFRISFSFYVLFSRINLLDDWFWIISISNSIIFLIYSSFFNFLNINESVSLYFFSLNPTILLLL